MDRRLHRKSLLAAVALAAIHSVAFADEVATTWMGGDTSGSWFDATKWSSNIPNNNGTQTFDATISRSGSAGGPNVSLMQSASIYKLNLNSGTITIDKLNIALSVDGGITGSGTIVLPIMLSGKLISTNAPLIIGSGITVTNGGTIGDPSQPFFNHGTISSRAPVLITGDGIHNDGTISPGAFFGGTFTRSDLGTLGNGSYTIFGTMENQGRTFRIDANTPEQWILAGTINGGLLETSDGRSLKILDSYSGPPALAHAHLNGVTIDASVQVASLNLTIDDGIVEGHGDIDLLPAVEGPSRIASATNSLVINSGMTIHGGGGNGNGANGSGLGSATGQNALGTIVNHGLLRSEFSDAGITPEFAICTTAFTNDGTLSIGSTSFMHAALSRYNDLTDGPAPIPVTFAPGGTLAVDLSTNAGLGLLEINGSLDLSTINDSLLLTASSAIVPGTFYEIVSTTTGVTGTFDSVSTNFEVDYRANTIWAAAVPEPAGLAAIAMGLAVMKRRRTAATGERSDCASCSS